MTAEKDDKIVHAQMRVRKSVIKNVHNSDPTSKYDYCMVFKLTPENQQTDYSKYIVKQMTNAGLELMCYWSVQRDEIIVLIRCPVSLKIKKRYLSTFSCKLILFYLK